MTISFRPAVSPLFSEKCLFFTLASIEIFWVPVSVQGDRSGRVGMHCRDLATQAGQSKEAGRAAAHGAPLCAAG